MDYVCRVGTPSGEVVERTISASDERALRADLEQQGLYLLSLRRGLSLSLFRLRRRRVDPALPRAAPAAAAPPGGPLPPANLPREPRGGGALRQPGSGAAPVRRPPPPQP